MIRKFAAGLGAVVCLCAIGCGNGDKPTATGSRADNTIAPESSPKNQESMGDMMKKSTPKAQQDMIKKGYPVPGGQRPPQN